MMIIRTLLVNIAKLLLTEKFLCTQVEKRALTDNVP